MVLLRCGGPSRRVRLAAWTAILCASISTHRGSAVSGLTDRLPLRRIIYKDELEILGPQTFHSRPHVFSQLQKKGLSSAEVSVPPLSLLSEHQASPRPRGASLFSKASFLEVGAEAVRRGAVHATRLTVKLAGKQQSAAPGALPAAPRPSAQGAAAAPVSGQPRTPSTQATDLWSKTGGEREAAVSVLRGSLVRRGAGLTGSRRAGINRLAELYKADAASLKEKAAPAAREKSAGAAAAPAEAFKAPAGAAVTPQASKPLTELLAARGITGKQPGGLLGGRRTLTVKGEQEREETPAAGRLRDGREFRREREEEEKRKNEQEEKEKEAQARRKREEEEKKKEQEEKEREAQARRKREEEEKKKEQEEKEREAQARRKREEEEKKKEQEEKEREAQARRKREEEEKKKEEEKESAAAAAKRKDAAAGLAKLLGRKPGKKAILPEAEELERMHRKERELKALRKATAEELRKEAKELFEKIDEKARESQKEPVQPPLPELVKRVFVTEEEGEEKPTVDSRIPKEDLEKAIDAMQQQAKQYSEKFEYFPKGALRIELAKYDDPKGGCHTMASNWSACSVGCGSGARMRFTVGRSGSTCIRTAHSAHCVSSVNCKSGAEFFQKAARVKGPSEAQAEEYGRNISHNLVIKEVNNKVCVEFDTRLTQRVYTDEGLLGPTGTGRRIRLIKKYDPEKQSCVLSQEDVYVTRTLRWTMKEFEKTMLEGHNTIRRTHNVPLLSWNPLIAANVTKYLENQNKNHGCRMEHSPSDSRNIPGIEGPLGENLLITCSTGQVPKDAPQSWASEVHCYRFGKVGNPCTGTMGPLCSVESHAAGLMTGHYTQVVWSGSRMMGCGYAVCDRNCSGNRQMVLVGCQYSPAGNIVKERPYDIEVAKAIQQQVSNVLPEAPEDAAAVAKCQQFRNEMQQRNPKKVVLE